MLDPPLETHSPLLEFVSLGAGGTIGWVWELVTWEGFLQQSTISLPSLSKTEVLRLEEGERVFTVEVVVRVGEGVARRVVVVVVGVAGDFERGRAISKPSSVRHEARRLLWCLGAKGEGWWSKKMGVWSSWGFSWSGSSVRMAEEESGWLLGIC